MTEENRREVGDAVHRTALDLGFDQLGVAPAERPAHVDWYREWLDRGWQGEMNWMGRDDSVRRRLDPSDALPGCRSLIAVSLSCATPENLTGERPTESPTADEPFREDRCGSCRRCIEAFPTDAIRGPRELDARRCISYLTIELEGAIPVHLREDIGNRVFGCDISQEVCPWNRETTEAADPGLRLGKPVEPGTMSEWAEELLELDDAEFEARYGDTPYERPGRKGLLRNLCVGLGNSGSEEAAGVLLRAVDQGSDWWPSTPPGRCDGSARGLRPGSPGRGGRR